MKPGRTVEQTVYVVDDDAAIRVAMQALLDAEGRRSAIFDSADTFLAVLDDNLHGCLVLDIRLPGMGGIELHKELLSRACTLPVIFITGQADVPLAVTAMRNGALDFLEKPFDDERLLASIDRALEVDAAQNAEHEFAREVDQRCRHLTDREREVFDLVVTGKPNKVIAYELDVSQRTVEIHRSRVMKKMHARSLADLVRMHLALAGSAT